MIENKGLPPSPSIAKAQAKRLRSALSPELAITHNQALELVARVHGENSWGRLNSILRGGSFPQVGTASGSSASSVSMEVLPPNHVGQRALQALWRGLERAKDTQPSARTRAVIGKLLKQEIIPAVSLEEYLDTLDSNLGGMVFEMGWESLVKISGVETVTRFDKPRDGDSFTSGFEGLRPAAFAAVLIWLERLGFDTHPEAFYKPLIVSINASNFVDENELTCLFHSRGEKGRFQTSEYFVDAETKIGNVAIQDHEGRDGLNIRLARGSDPFGLIASLRIYR